MSLKSTHTKDYYNLLNDIIENESSVTPPSNEVLLVAMGYELEIQGIEKTQISAIIRKDIEDKLYEKQFKKFIPREDYRWHSGYFYIIMKKNNWSNSNNTFTPPEESDNSSINTKNKRMIVLCDKLIDICKITKYKAMDENTPLFEDVFGKKEMKEFYKQRMAMLKNCKSGLNYKTKVPVNTESILLECVATTLSSLSTCIKKFMEIRITNMEDQGKFMTTKQLTKFQKGDKQSQLNLLKPLTHDEAVFLDYWGIQCTCESWRIRETQNSNNLECYDCNRILPKIHASKCSNCHVPLYKERLLHMVKHKNECPNCQASNDLPQVLVDYAKS